MVEDRSPDIRLVPVTFRDACEFVQAWHRHHRPPVGHKFSVGVASGDTLVGVAMVGRPVARHLDDGLTLEVNCTATDGTKNVNSMLLSDLPMTDIDRWWHRAACLGYPVDIFFAPEVVDNPRHTGSRNSNYYDRARTICAGCEVAEQCLAETLTGPSQLDTWGFRGGKSPKERRKMRGEWRQAHGLPRDVPCPLPH